MKFFFIDVDEHLDGHGAPDLLSGNVLAVAQKLLDAQFLFDPFEEQFQMKTVFVQSCIGQGRQGRVVGQEDQSLLGSWVIELDTAQVLGVAMKNVVTVQCDGLIAEDAAAPVHRGRIHAPGVHIAFGAGHKDCAVLMHLKQSRKVIVASTQDVERVMVQDKDVQNIDLLHIVVADVDAFRNRASDIQQVVQLDGCLGLEKRGPVEQAQIESGVIQCLAGFLEIEYQVLVQIKLASAPNQNFGQFGPDSPVARVLGICPGGTVNAEAKYQSEQFAQVNAKRHFDVAQTLAPNQMDKSYKAKLLQASQSPITRVTAIAAHYEIKVCPWNELHDLSEQGLADIHRKFTRGLNLGNHTRISERFTNRHQFKLTSSQCQYGLAN